MAKLKKNNNPVMTCQVEFTQNSWLEGDFISFLNVIALLRFRAGMKNISINGGVQLLEGPVDGTSG